VPIILMSGYGQAIDSTDLAGNRINNFIQKPFVIDELAAVIRKTLRH
jgi:DNA-binding response OmpR family regulator